MPEQQQLEKNTNLGKYTTTDDVKRAEFEHKGDDIVVLYRPPTVAQVQAARQKAMDMRTRGRSMKVNVKAYDMELDLVQRCIIDTNIPGIPEGGREALKNINSWDLWEKLLTACEIMERSTINRDDLEEAAEEVIEELGGEGYVSVKRLAKALQTDGEEDDIKKS